MIIRIGDIFEYRLQVASIDVRVLGIKDDRVLAEAMKFPQYPVEWLEIKHLGKRKEQA